MTKEIARRAALEMILDKDIEHEEGDNPITSLSWAIGQRVTYEDALEGIAERAVEIYKDIQRREQSAWRAANRNKGRCLTLEPDVCGHCKTVLENARRAEGL